MSIPLVNYVCPKCGETIQFPDPYYASTKPVKPQKVEIVCLSQGDTHLLVPYPYRVATNDVQITRV